MAQHQPKLRKLVISVLLIIALLVAGQVVIKIGEWIAEEPPMVDAEPSPLVVSTMELASGEVVEKLRGFGLAQPIRRARISSQIQGNILEIPERHRVGAFVERGAELVLIDPRPFEAEVLRRQAMVEEARESLVRVRAELHENREKRRFLDIELQIARAELERAEDLLRQQAISESQRDQARAALQGVEQRVSDLNRQDAVSRAEETRLQATLRAREVEASLAGTDLAYTTPAAPFDGIIEARLVNEGDLVSPGTGLFVLIDAARLELPIEIPASGARGLREGAAAELRTESRGDPIATGRVERISPSISTGNRTVSAFVMIDQDSRETNITPGTFLSATVDGRRFEDVLAIPRGAILDGGIYLVEDGRARRHEPNFIEVLDDVALTRDPLPSGAPLILTGFERLYDGARVEAPSPDELEEMPFPVPSGITAVPGGDGG